MENVCHLINHLVFIIKNFALNLGILFCTILLALFGYLQWKAIDKQNNQHLFKLKLECTKTVFSLLADIQKLILQAGDLLPEKADIITCKDKLAYNQTALIIISTEVSLLFDNKLDKAFNRIIDIVNASVYDLYVELGKTDFTEDDRKETIRVINQELSAKITSEQIIVLLKDQTRLNKNYIVDNLNKFNFWISEKFKFKQSS